MVLVVLMPEVGLFLLSFNMFATPSTSLIWSGNSFSYQFLALASGPSGGLRSLSQSYHRTAIATFVVGSHFCQNGWRSCAGKYINLADLLPADNGYVRLVLTGS